MANRIILVKEIRRLELIKNGKATLFIVEETAYEGVRKIAGKVAEDVNKVCGIKPNLAGEIRSDSERIVLFATLGKSKIIDQLSAQGKVDVSVITGKWETYLIRILKNPFPGIAEAVIICGSDKRGTIYGMFSLSEYIGVSPLCYWGDVEPQKRKDIILRKDFEKTAKEPSVKYRGFFINDEWPCFGKWAFSHFGGFTHEMYEHVFELLLRLKGNYLWPAMWTSCFALDGPGCLNEELADLYGVVIGYSHHEPCLRSGGEFDLVKGEDSVYGKEWNFYTNREGLTRFWADGLKRSGRYDNLITIGIRGEWDSPMLEEDAALQQNIDLLKDVITVQRRLIHEYVEKDGDQVPQLLALYKEVEAFFYGDENTAGLKDWDGLRNTICMLCEDNYGFMRSLPTPELLEQMKKKECGFGMYYHLDYHGAPVSYEWMPSTPLFKVWEQMCMAYDYGVRDVWIVNVGDIKGNEVALGYFLALAYDYGRWGSSRINSWKDYLGEWFRQTFPVADVELREQMKWVLIQFMEMNGRRRPEALHPYVYHPCHYLETDRMLHLAGKIEQMNEESYGRLLENGNQESLNAYYSMIYYPAKMSVNLLKMHLYAGKNEHYAKQGRVIANEYARKVTECIKEDTRLSEEFADFREMKWKGMELEQHVGFTSWNEDDCRYPQRILVEPYCEPRLSISRKDREQAVTRVFKKLNKIVVDDFLYAGNEEVVLELANSGTGVLNFEITGETPWLKVIPNKGTVKIMQEVRLILDRSILTEEIQKACLKIQSSQSELIVEKKVDVEVEVLAGLAPDIGAASAFLPDKGIIAMEAHHYCARKDTMKGAFYELDGYGRSGHGMKVFPVTAHFAETEDAPALSYRFLAMEEGQYQVEVWVSPTNSVQGGMPLRFTLEATDGIKQIVNVLPADFKAGDWDDLRWSQGVLDQIRIVRTMVNCTKGIQTITIGALEPGLILERILVYRQENEPNRSYLGPVESCRT